MDNITTFIRKVLLSQSYFEGGFEFQFIDVTLDEDGTSYFNITVNVILPKKGQSYIIELFSGYIHKIINNVWKYIGESYSYSEKIFVDGEEPVNGGIYISPEKELEILNTVRRELNRIEINTKKNRISFNIEWKRANGNFYQSDDAYVDFYFYIGLSNFEINGHKVTPSLKLSDEIAGIMSDSLYDSDSFRSELDDILYTSLRDEVDLHNVDTLYLQGMWYVAKIDGFEVSPTMRGNDISDEMFT